MLRRFLEEQLEGTIASNNAITKEAEKIESQIIADKAQLENLGTEEDLDERRKLTREIHDLKKEIRNNEKEIKQLGGGQQLSRYGLDQETLEQILSTTTSRGTFSAYDVMRGGIEQNETLLELRAQTELLESINENANTAQ